MSELAANSQITEEFTIQTANAATMVINASVTSVLADANSANNSDQSTLTVSAVEAAKVSSGGGGSLSVWLIFSMLLLVTLTTIVRRKVALQRIVATKQQ